LAAPCLRGPLERRTPQRSPPLLNREGRTLGSLESEDRGNRGDQRDRRSRGTRIGRYPPREADPQRSPPSSSERGGLSAPSNPKIEKIEEIEGTRGIKGPEGPGSVGGPDPKPPRRDSVPTRIVGPDPDAPGPSRPRPDRDTRSLSRPREDRPRADGARLHPGSSGSSGDIRPRRDGGPPSPAPRAVEEGPSGPRELRLHRLDANFAEGPSGPRESDSIDRTRISRSPESLRDSIGRTRISRGPESLEGARLPRGSSGEIRPRPTRGPTLGDSETSLPRSSERATSANPA